MKWLDGRGLSAAALTSALALFLMPVCVTAQESLSPGAYAADPDTPPYLAPKPKPLRRSYVEPAAPPEARSPGQAKKTKKAKRATVAAPTAQAPKLTSQPKPKPKAAKASPRPAKPPQKAKPYKASPPAPKPPRAAAVAGHVSIKAVQQALNRAGYPAPHDGKLGKSTRRALRNFQRDHRLPVTGQADRPTLIKLGLN